LLQFQRFCAVEAIEHLLFELIYGTITGLKKYSTLVSEINSKNPAVGLVGDTFDISHIFKFRNCLMRGLRLNK